MFLMPNLEPETGVSGACLQPALKVGSTSLHHATKILIWYIVTKYFKNFCAVHVYRVIIVDNAQYTMHIQTSGGNHRYLHYKLMKSRGTQMESFTQKIRKLCHFVNIRRHLKAFNINYSTLHFRHWKLNWPIRTTRNLATVQWLKQS